MITSTRVSQLEIWDRNRRAKYILKHFPELKSVKWLILNVWSLCGQEIQHDPALTDSTERSRR